MWVILDDKNVTPNVIVKFTFSELLVLPMFELKSLKSEIDIYLLLTLYVAFLLFSLQINYS